MKELNLNANKINNIDFHLLSSENLNQLQHLDLSENPLVGFKDLDECPNHPLTIHMQPLKNFTILEELEKSKCFEEHTHFRIDMTGSETEESFECDHWCKLSDQIQKQILIGPHCNCTEALGPENDGSSATSSGNSSGTTSNGLKKVFFVILFLIFLLVIRYHWKTIRSLWFKLRNKNHSDHGKDFQFSTFVFFRNRYNARPPICF